MQGAYKFAMSGNDPIKGGPDALSKLQEVFARLDKAEKVAPEDPEFNLIKGYIDLIMAVNLPFGNVEQTIERLEKAAPDYLVNRGLAVGYRDLKKYDKALEYANKALEETPDNPEVRYLKAQIMVKQGREQEDNSLLEKAQDEFRTALANPGQLPKNSVAQIFIEYCKNQENILERDLPCIGMRNDIRKANGEWGPEELPSVEEME